MTVDRIGVQTFIAFGQKEFSFSPFLELTSVNFKDLDPDEVLGEKFSGGKKCLLVSFKNKAGGALGRYEFNLKF